MSRTSQNQVFQHHRSHRKITWTLGKIRYPALNFVVTSLWTRGIRAQDFESIKIEKHYILCMHGFVNYNLIFLFYYLSCQTISIRMQLSDSTQKFIFENANFPLIFNYANRICLAPYSTELKENSWEVIQEGKTKFSTYYFLPHGYSAPVLDAKLRMGSTNWPYCPKRMKDLYRNHYIQAA